MRSALFLDRDGTIIHDQGYLSDTDQIKFYGGVLEKIALLKDKGFKIFIVTNQSGVGRGYFSEKKLKIIHKHLLKLMNDNNAGVDGLRYCPHTPDDKCDCRKPNPKMVLSLAEEFNIDLGKSFFIGDKTQDVSTGKNSHCKTVLITHGKSRNELCAKGDEWAEPDFLADTPAEALGYVCRQADIMLPQGD
ncbi:HAD family hydrolase [bacterium]|nr:HAD family hydrolase [bacterium]